MASSLTVEIVTNERIVLSESDVEMVSAPGSEGMMGILPNHAPLVTTLSAGELRIKKSWYRAVDGRLRWLHGSAAEQGHRTRRCCREVDEIDIERAEEARKRAEEAIARGGDSIRSGRSRSSVATRAGSAPHQRPPAGWTSPSDI